MSLEITSSHLSRSSN